MSKPAPISQKKRKLEDGMKGKIQKPRKKTKKQRSYHSSSEEEEEVSDTGFAPINLNDSDEEAAPTKPMSKAAKQINKVEKAPKQSESEEESESSEAEEEGDDEDRDGSESDAQTTDKPMKRKTSKRNDPEAFSTSMSKILSTKLSRSARRDPVLSRSKEAADTSSKIADERLEQRAKAKLRAEKKEELERGRIKDVLGVSTGETGKIAEEEKRLRKIAQRGVIKLFNAVRAAQVRGEEAARAERMKGTVGMANREEKVNEMSKQGFLELISSKSTSAPLVEEA